MARDLQVLPDFSGNRSPLADATATGVIHGLTLDSSFDALARLYYATAVGIALGTRHIVDALDTHGYKIDTVHLTGGHLASPVLVRLYADATGCAVVLPKEEDSASWDGPRCGGGCRALESLSAAASAMTRQGTSIDPAPEASGQFDAQYRRFLLMQDHRRDLARLVGANNHRRV